MWGVRPGPTEGGPEEATEGPKESGRVGDTTTVTEMNGGPWLPGG